MITTTNFLTHTLNSQENLMPGQNRPLAKGALLDNAVAAHGAHLVPATKIDGFIRIEADLALPGLYCTLLPGTLQLKSGRWSDKWASKTKAKGNRRGGRNRGSIWKRERE
jgi:hypothetical protein